MPQLFDPLSLRSITLRNRIGVSPMCQYSAKDGLVNDWHLVHLSSRAVGGAGLVIAEATAVEARGRISPGDLGIWSDMQIDMLARAAMGILSHGAVPGIQIAHAGRKACVHRPWEGGGPISIDDPEYWQIVGADDIAFAPGHPTPQALSRGDIKDIQAAFRSGAARVLEAGFTWLEIHAAHGYLIHSFYSPVSNKRDDEYGGSFDNRVRFLIETVQAVRQVWPDRLPLSVRISCTDWTPGGWSIEESIELARRLKAEGVDIIDCSSGGNLPDASVPTGPGYQIPLAEAIRRGAQMPVAAVGLLSVPTHVDEIIRNSQADVALLGREMLRNPYWPLHAAQALKQPMPTPNQYLRAF